MLNTDILDYCEQYLTSPGGYESFAEAKLRYCSGKPMSEYDISIVVTTSSFLAAVLRTAYKRYVKDNDISPQDYWDTVVTVFSDSGIWSEDWRKPLKSTLGLQLVKDTLHPAWTPIGLCGTNWRTLYQMLEIWCSRLFIQDEAV